MTSLRDDIHLTTSLERVMSRALVSVSPDQTVAQCCSAISAAGIGCALVCEPDGRLVGMLTERDVLNRVVALGRDSVRTLVSEVMTANSLTLRCETTLAEASELVNQRGFRHIPVVSPAGRPVGVVSMRDLFRIRLAHAEARLEEELRALRALRELLALDEDSRIATLLSVNERLQELALTDELTGLYNHRYFVRRLDEEVARSKRTHAPLSLLMADIDHFKRVNDTYGHQIGDLVLRHVARILREAVEGPSLIVRLRKSDTVARYGGEEFAILLLDAATSGALIVAERVRSAIESCPANVGEHGLLRITVSVGAAALPEHASDGAALVTAADAALYRAKADARNCVRYGVVRGQSRPD